MHTPQFQTETLPNVLMGILLYFYHWQTSAKGEIMTRTAICLLALCLTALPALAEETPPHTIAVAGEVELLLPPDYATIELGVVTQGPLVGDALAENSVRMTRVIDAVKSLGISEKDIRTSTFLIQPKYEKILAGEFDTEAFRTIVGYFISNKVSVTVKDLTNVAKIIDQSVKAGANASGTVSFNVNGLTAHLDEARRKAIENAHHKAEVLTEAAHIQLGPAISITDNQADMSYNGRADLGSVETVVVTGARAPTPIEPGLVSIHSTVTVVYATR